MEGWQLQSQFLQSRVKPHRNRKTFINVCKYKRNDRGFPFFRRHERLGTVETSMTPDDAPLIIL